MPPLSFDPETVLEGERVRLRPFEERDLDAAWAMLNEPESQRLTGTHATFTREQVDRWYRSRGETADRLDLAITLRDEGRMIGEAVLSNLDVDNRSCGFRISLLGPAVFGAGYGTEATKLMVAHAFRNDLHRVSLEVFDFNVRAQRAYEKAGFTVEGVKRDALHWDGEYHDTIMMARLANNSQQVPQAVSGQREA